MSTQPIVLQPSPPAPAEPVGRALFVRGRAFTSRSRLVREIAEGADPQADPARAVCASRLCGMRTRRSMAASLANVIDAAMEPPRGISSAVRVAREDVLAARSSINFLIGRLRGDHDVNPRGVAIVDRLLRDAFSPLYLPHGDRTLQTAIRDATLAL